jgi:probable addiction module antidote protein
MKTEQTSAWDVVDHLETEEDMASYLEAALCENDPVLIAAALGDIARAKGMSQVAKQAGLGRESLYKALSSDGNPEFATVLKVIRALGLRLQATTMRVELFGDHHENDPGPFTRPCSRTDEKARERRRDFDKRLHRLIGG